MKLLKNNYCSYLQFNALLIDGLLKNIRPHLIIIGMYHREFVDHNIYYRF